MCRMSALAATAVALALTPAFVMAKSKDKEADKAPAAAAAAPGAPLAQAPPAPKAKATREQRQVAQRGDALTRAAFWTREFEIDPADAEAAISLSQALRGLRSHDDAVSVMTRFLMIQADNVDALLELARVHIARGQGFYAVEPARRAQALAPRDWRAPSLLGVAYEQAERDEEALAAHRQAQAIAPNNPAVLSNLAMFLAGRGDRAEAERLLRAAAAMPGSTIQVRQNLALVLGLQGRLDEAERLARQDLPPEVVANNMAYLRAASAASAPAPGPTQRNWGAMTGQP